MIYFLLGLAFDIKGINSLEVSWEIGFYVIIDILILAENHSIWNHHKLAERPETQFLKLHHRYWYLQNEWAALTLSKGLWYLLNLQFVTWPMYYVTVRAAVVWFVPRKIKHWLQAIELSIFKLLTYTKVHYVALKYTDTMFFKHTFTFR